MFGISFLKLFVGTTEYEVYIIYIFKSHRYPLKTCKAKFAVGLI